MDDMINYNYCFKVNPNIEPQLVKDLLYYIEFMDDGHSALVWWKVSNEWEFSDEYTRDDFRTYVNNGDWIIQNYSELLEKRFILKRTEESL
jgi:hypothetical protein